MNGGAGGREGSPAKPLFCTVMWFQVVPVLLFPEALMWHMDIKRA